MEGPRPARLDELTACGRCKSENTEDSGIPNVNLRGNKRRCKDCGTVAAGIPIQSYFDEQKENAR